MQFRKLFLKVTNSDILNFSPFYRRCDTVTGLPVGFSIYVTISSWLCNKSVIGEGCGCSRTQPGAWVEVDKCGKRKHARKFTWSGTTLQFHFGWRGRFWKSSAVTRAANPSIQTRKSRGRLTGPDANGVFRNVSFSGMRTFVPERSLLSKFLRRLARREGGEFGVQVVEISEEERRRAGLHCSLIHKLKLNPG